MAKQSPPDNHRDGDERPYEFSDAEIKTEADRLLEELEVRRIFILEMREESIAAADSLLVQLDRLMVRLNDIKARVAT